MFSHLIIIEPLGSLYGSAGPFLSPDNLVGRSGKSFPPSAATVSGLYAARYSEPGTNEREEKTRRLELSEELRIAGPFWAYQGETENFYVPTPLNYLVKLPSAKTPLTVAQGEIQGKMHWNEDQEQWLPVQTGKFDSDTWLEIKQWDNPETVSAAPWQYLPHLHPRLETNQRRVDTESTQGSLFLENAVQMHPDTCLVYLTTIPIDEGWYRFGGEGHLAQVQCQKMNDESTIKQLLKRPVGNYFALLTPAMWGSNRFSYRLPILAESQTPSPPPEWENAKIFTQRPTPFRYRLGGKPEQPKRLSRGRYAVSAGTVYRLEEAISTPWFQWNPKWFPQEGYSFQRWGCGLALPLTA